MKLSLHTHKRWGDWQLGNMDKVYPNEGFMVWKIGTRQNQECRNKINALRLKKL